MSVVWIVLSALVWVVGLLMTLALVRMGGDEDRKSRHQEKRLDPDSDVTITREGNG